MIRHLVAAALLLGAGAACADPKAEVLAAVGDALKALNTNDAPLFSKVVLPQALILSQSYAADGALKTRLMTTADMAARISTPGPRIDERIQDPQVMIRGDLAHVWSPYTFDLGGKRLHCGIDSFGLARIDGDWRITSLTWTAEPSGCPK